MFPKCSLDALEHCNAEGTLSKSSQNIACRLGHGMQIESEKSAKNFHIQRPKKKNKFLVYLAMVKLRKNFRKL